jgi:hypothetical protein
MFKLNFTTHFEQSPQSLTTKTERTKFLKYHMQILLGDFNAKRGREDIFKPTIWNEIIHKIFLICIGGGGVQTGSTRHVGHLLAYCSWPGDCEDGEFGGMNGRGNRSTRRKPATTPLCPPQIPLD